MTNLAELIPIYISEPEMLAQATAEWADVRALAIDTEANSLHSYSERIALIQVSTDERDYIIDPLALTDLTPLAPILDDPQIEKVFHAAENDILGLKRDFGFTVRGVFDTMWASRILGFPRVGLADLLREHFDVVLDKRMQRYDWNTRPLDPAALTYAVQDTHYLLALREILYGRLIEAKRWEEARQEFERLGRATPAPRTFDIEGFWRVKGAYDIQPRERAVLRELYRFRDEQARVLDRPPFKILTDTTLIELSKAQPKSIEDLRRSHILTAYLIRRFGQGILSSIQLGQSAPTPYRPRDNDRPDDTVLARYEALRVWRKATGATRGVDPDVILSNAALWTLARQAPASLAALADLDVMSDYKLSLYGPELLEVLAAHS